MTVSKMFSASLALFALVLLVGCAGRPPRRSGGTESFTRHSEKVSVEAYLFDVVVKRESKTTSLRLDVFDADSAVSLGGRAYLGKGALKGRITRDSLAAYFPTTDEYLAQKWKSFTLGADSSRDLSGLDFAHLFSRPPDTGTFADSIRVEITHAGNEVVELYICRGGLSSTSARWGIALKYVTTEGNLRLGRFEYNSRDMEITCVRREYRPRARVSSDRFSVPIPATATPVNP